MSQESQIRWGLIPVGVAITGGSCGLLISDGHLPMAVILAGWLLLAIITILALLDR